MDDDSPTNKRPPIDLTVSGRKCRIHRNDRVARSLEEGAHLMELRRSSTNDDDWGGDGHASPTSASRSAPLLVDRHDARTLLDELSLREAVLDDRHGGANLDSGIRGASSDFTSRPLIEEDSEEDVAARNFERYASLPEYPPCILKCEEMEGQAKGREKTALRKSSLDDNGHADGMAHHVGKNVPDNNDEEEKTFELSEEQLRGIPPGIPLPKTMRHNTIIEHTASRIASNNQLEVFLKVKQAANADFSFLNPSDELHTYYVFLKGKPNSLAKKEVDDDSTNECNNPLSGLLGGYDSSSDESAGPTNNNDSSGASGKESGSKAEEDQSQNKEEGGIIPPQTTELNKKRKADRLERLRAWKERRGV